MPFVGVWFIMKTDFTFELQLWKPRLSIPCYRSMGFLYITPRILQNYLFYYFHKNKGFQTYWIPRKRWTFETKERRVQIGKWAVGKWRLGTGKGCSIDCNPALVVWTTGMSSPGNVRNLIRARIVQYQQASRRGWYASTLFSSSPDRLRETWYYWVPVLSSSECWRWYQKN
jgi:hypothetical protein